MVRAGIKLFFAGGITFLLLGAYIGQAGAHDRTSEASGVSIPSVSALPPQGRVVVLSGAVVEVEPRDLIILHEGQEIVVKGGSLIRSGMRNSRDPLSEGMLVTVEGVTGGANEIVASRVTRGPYYDEIPYRD